MHSGSRAAPRAGCVYTSRMAKRIEASKQKVDELKLDGRLRGDVDARKEATLGADAELVGTLSAPRATVHPSATVRGRLSMPLDLPRGVGQARRRSSAR